ncbi:MAG: 2OG-Fe(II) oxygenase [Rhodospirillales bacterium]|nr:2OG-Fe(II) oxygenase [Rhodospirillales bacterium]MSP80260.1 2OG-Fe(II) oxygenase [Rhodospirillales bacterium]
MSVDVRADTGETFRRALKNARVESRPYRHWFLSDSLPAASARAIAALPIAPPPVSDTYGKRESYNDIRVFMSARDRARYPVCGEVAEAFQAPETARAVEKTFGVKLRGSLLRIEYCQDVDGFWLEPHVDISAKLVSMLIFLCDQPAGENWGTDIYDADRKLVANAECRFNHGYVFVPAKDTWHGFHRRTITGIRKSIIVNYVTEDWRARHELAFPDRPID